MKKTLLPAVALAGLVLLPMPVASAAEPVQLVSINQAGTATGNALSYDGESAASYGGFGGLTTSRPVTSRDGRFVVFGSLATDLVSTPTSGQANVFRRDTVTGTTTLVSVSRSGQEGNAPSGQAYLSADGRYVIFQSSATDLVAGSAQPAATGVFIRDVQAGVTSAVSVSPAGVFANAPAYVQAISGNGRYVVFGTSATNLQPSCTRGRATLFVRDTVGRTTTVLNVDDTGTNCGDDGAYGATQISDDGRYVSFVSDSTDLVARDRNAQTDAFVRDRRQGRTILVSVNAAGESSAGGGSQPSMSGNGRMIVFLGCGSDLVGNDDNDACDIFVRDIVAGQTRLASINRAGTQSGNNPFDPVSQQFLGGSFQPAISLNGRYVAFTSGSTDLVAGDRNKETDLFVRDLQTGTTTLVRASGDDPGFLPLFSASGRFLLFTGFSTRDLYVRDQQTGRVTLVNAAQPGSTGASSPPNGSRISRDGSTVVFTSLATNLVATSDANPPPYSSAPSGADVFLARTG